MPFTYREVRDVYDDLQKAGVVTTSLPEWSDEMNRLTKSDLYGAGLSDNVLKRASVGVDRLLESTGLPRLTESFGRAVGEVFGMPEVGASAGRSIPRGFVDFAPLLLSGPAGWAGAAGLAGTALLSGVHAYTESGSPAAGVIGGATAAALPGVAGVLERGTARALASYLPKAVGSVAGFGAGQLGAAGLMGGGTIAEQAFTPDAEISNPFTPEFWLAQGIQTIPFAAIHLANKAVAPLMKTREVMEQKQAEVEEKKSPPIIRMPRESEMTLQELKSFDEANARIAELTLGVKRQTFPPEDLVKVNQELQDLSRQQRELTRGTGTIEGLALEPTESETHVPVVVENYVLNRSGKSAVFTVADAPENAETGLVPGTRIQYSIGKFPRAIEELEGGRRKVPVPVGHYTVVKDFIAEQKAKFVGENPHLPLSPRTDRIQQIRSHWSQIRSARETLEKATNGFEITEAKRLFNAARESAGMSLYDDARFSAEFPNLAPEKAAAAVMARKERQAIAWENTLNERETAREFVVKALNERLKADVGDQEQVRIGNEYNEILEYTNSLEHGPLLYDSGELDRMFVKWVQGGRKGALQDKVETAVTNLSKQGTEAKAKAAGLPVVDDETLNEVLNERLTEVVNDPAARTLYEKEVGRPELSIEQRRFQEIHDVFGDEMFHSGGITVREAERMNLKLPDELRFKGADEYISFAELPYVQAWRFALRRIATAKAPGRVVGPWSLKPALKKGDGEVVSGEYGDEHKSIYDRNPEVVAFKDKVGMDQFAAPEHGFVDQAGRFYSRREAADMLGEAETLESQRLKVLQAEAVAKAPRITAGEGWVWGLGPFDAEAGVLNVKHRIPKTGKLLVSAFRNMVGEGNKPLKTEEIEVMKLLVPEAFDKDGNVDVRKLYKELPNRQPVTTVTYGQEGKVSEAKAELDKMTHEWFDAQPEGLRGVVRQGMDNYSEMVRITDNYVSDQAKDNHVTELTKAWNNPEWRKKLDEFLALKRKVASEPPDISPRATSYYNQISPFDTKKFPVVRVDVVLPRDKIPYEDWLKQHGWSDSEVTRKRYAGSSYDRGAPTAPNERILWQQDNLHENLPNTLGWAMVQFVPKSLIAGTKTRITGQEFNASLGYLRAEADNALVYLNRSNPNLAEVAEIKQDLLRRATRDGVPEHISKLIEKEDWKTLAQIKLDDFAGDPNELVAFVGEQQSRWGQERQKWEAHLNAGIKRDKARLMEVGKLLSEMPTNAGQERTDLLEENSRLHDYVKQNEAQLAKGPAQHPLLPLQHVLVLKAVIAEAQKRGVTRVVVSDGETAMMTEGHDKGATEAYPTSAKHIQETMNYSDAAMKRHYGEGWQNGQYMSHEGTHYRVDLSPDNKVLDIDTEMVNRLRPLNGKRGYLQPSQSGGMRLHYDTTLPSAMAKLTGEKGERVEMGVHKNAQPGSAQDRAENFATEMEARQFAGEAGIVRQLESGEWRGRQITPDGSPVFRNPDGTSKRYITGMSYNLTQAFANLGAQGGFTLGDPARAPQRVQGRVARFVADTPEDQARIDSWGLPRGGTGIAEALTKSPWFGGLAKDLIARYPKLLERVTAQIVQMDGGSRALKTSADRVNILVADSLLRTDEFTQHQELMHELLHGLTLHLIDDPVRAAPFEGLRQRLIRALPKDERAALNEALISGWLERYNSDQAEFSELHPNPDVAFRLYGLLNNRELLSQGWTSPAMKAFMLKVPGETTTAWQTFKNFVKTLLGVQFKGTAFDEFMDHSGNLMDAGEYIANFRDFGERYLQGRGLEPVLARSQISRALGVVTALKWGQEPWDALEQPADAVGMARRFKTEMQLSQHFASPKAEDTKGILAEYGHEGNKSGVEELTREAVTEGTDISAGLMLMSPEISQHVFARLADTREVLDVVRASLKEPGLVNIFDAKLLKKPVTEALRAVDRVLRIQDQIDMAMELAQDMSAVAPSEFARRNLDVAKAPERGKDLEAFIPPEKLSLFQRTFSLMGRVARANPATAEIINVMAMLRPRADQMRGRIMTVLGMDLKNPGAGITEAGVEKSVKELYDPKIRDAANHWYYLNNKLADVENRPVTLLPVTHPEIAKLRAKYSPKDWESVEDAVLKMNAMKETTDLETRKAMSEEAVAHAAKIVLVDQKSTAANAIAAAKKLWAAVYRDYTNPMEATLGQAEIAEVQRTMTPEGWLDLVKSVQISKQIVDEAKAWQNENRAWGTAQRYQKFLVHFTKGGKAKLGQADDKVEAEAYVKAAGGDVKSIRLEPNFKEAADFPVLGADAGGIAQRLIELEESRLAILRSKVSPERWEELQTEVAILKQYSGAEQFAREAAYASGGLPKFEPPPRRLSKGAEHLPWLRNQISWANRQSNYWTRRVTRAMFDLHLDEPTIASNPELRAQLKSWGESLSRGDPDFATNTNAFVRTWLMGMNVATVISNAFQTPLTTLPELIRMNGGRTLDGFRRLTDTIAEVASARGIYTGEHKRLIDDATRLKERDYTQYDPDRVTQEIAATKWVAVMDHKKPRSTATSMKNMAGAVSNAAFLMFRASEKVNHDISLIAAFDLARSRGATYEAALKEAVEFNRAVNFGGGKWQRPMLPFSGKDDFSRSFAMFATNMQNFNLGVVGQLGQYVREGWFRPPGLKPAEIFAARKAALTMLGVQMSAAGLLGMPFMAGGIALMNQLFPGLEINKNLRQNVAEFFADDDENGSTWTNIAMTGLPSMLGWDMQSRLALGNIVPGISEFNGFQPEALLGPPYSVVSNFLTGARRLASGEARGAEAFLPPAIKKIVQLSVDRGTVRDYRDRPVFTPTPGEVAGIAVGFQPKRLSDFNVAARIADASDRLASDAEGNFRQAQASDTMKGNFGSVRQQLLAKLHADPNYDVAGAIRGITRAAEELTFPRDLRREGSARMATDRAQFLATFGLPSSAATEVQRVQFRSVLAQKLGLPQALRPADLQRAMVMDQLRTQSPTATRQALRRQADLMLSPARGGPLLQE